MTVAFVISRAETEVVLATQGEDSPRMDGGLFKFTRDQLPAYLNTLATFSAGHEVSSEEFRASARLQERLGTWLGRNMAASDEGQTPSLMVPDEDPETPTERRRRRRAFPVADATSPE